jgi:hypothetical protein
LQDGTSADQVKAAYDELKRQVRGTRSGGLAVTGIRPYLDLER